MSACAMVWPRQEELEWSGWLLGNVVLLLMYDGVSALCLPCQTVLEVGSVAGFLAVHFLLYATQDLTLEPGTASSPSWAIICCLATAVLLTGHLGGLACSWRWGAAGLCLSAPFLCSLQVANDIYLLTLSMISTLKCPHGSQENAEVSCAGVCVAVFSNFVFFGLFPDPIWKHLPLLVSHSRQTYLSLSSSCSEYNSYLSLVHQGAGVTPIL